MIFEDIHCDAVKKAAKSTFGSGGPTKIDSKLWKTLLCSKAYGNLTDQLCEEIAIFTRRLCTEDVPQKVVSLLLSGRHVPLKKKDNGVRPVGIGKTLRGIMGKTVARVLKEDIQLASGTL